MVTVVWTTLIGSIGALVAQIARPPMADGAEGENTPARRRDDFHGERAFPFDRIPDGALERAWQQREAARVRQSNVSRGQAAGFEWKSLGPAPDQLAPRQLTGRVRAIAVHPLDASIVYVGSASGGVWKTTNDGASWRPLTDGQCNLNTGALAIDPANPRVVYVGTGEPRQSVGCGLLRSSDDGQTWTRLGAATFGTSQIARILIDPATAGAPDRTTIYVGSTAGFYKSTNGGQTLQRLSPARGGDVWMDPRHANTLYAAMLPSGQTSGALLKSTDGGATWATLGGGLPSSFGYAALALDTRSSDTIYAVLTDTGGVNLAGLFKTRDGGQSWTALGRAGVIPRCNQAPLTAQVTCPNCWYNLVLALDPVQANTLYFGATQLHKSTDDGATWVQVLNGRDPCSTSTAYAHVDQHDIVFDRNSRLLLGNDGGIIASTNQADSWINLNTNLSLRQFYRGVSIHPTDPSIIFAGAQDNAVMRFRDGTWINVFGGDGGFSAIDDNSPNTVYVERQWTAGSGSDIARSDNGGNSFTAKESGIDLNDRAQFIPPLIIDRRSPNRLAFGTYRVYLTDDRGDNWRIASHDMAPPSGTVRALAFAPSNGANLWAGTSNGRLWLTESSGSSWSEVTNGLPTRVITDIAVSPDDARTAYVALSGTGTAHVYKTTNSGQSWTAISSGLPDTPVNAILIDPVPGTLFAGTDVGVFRTLNDGGSWELFSDGLPNVPVTELVQNTRLGLLVAATYGRGLFFIGGLCSSEIEPNVIDVDAVGAQVQVSVAAPCSWTTNLNATAFPWLRVTSRTSAGATGQVTIAVDANTGSTLRTAHINIAAEVLTVRQRGR
jgi:photosystem II stability/assembly factor-like uncharacterized protein